jgi:Tol biopolymer transport system component
MTGDIFGDRSAIAVVKEDGKGLIHLAENADNPAFSPDGKKIVFNASSGGPDVCRLPYVYSMKLDGSGRTLLVRFAYSDDCYRTTSTSWQPLP